MTGTAGAAALAVLLFVLFPSPRAEARGTKGAEESFVARPPLEALEQPESKRTVGRLEPGRPYPLLERGGPSRAWCKVGVGRGDGWVRCDAGRIAGSSAAAPVEKHSRVPERQKRDDAACASSCDRAPLFADPPKLTDVDRAVLALCPTDPGGVVPASQVRGFLATHYADPRIQRALSAAGRPGSGAGVRASNLDWLTSLWVSTGPRNAFTHVFCGDDWGREKVGGLHYLPRYAQLEREGKLCYGGPAKGGSALRGDQYLITYSGLWPWSCGRKPVGGFAAKHDPVELIAVATRAFAKCCDRATGRREGGVFQATDLGQTRYRIWCGTRNGTYGIATIHPTDERASCGE